jgi:zinc/manganese transport system ATP-binding protein
VTSTQPEDLLRLENIGVRLGGRQILTGVSFTVAPGQFTGLIGPNGAGKTTLLRVILGLQPPSEGRILLDGSPRSRRGGGLIGYVPQKLAIDQDVPLRARDVVGLGIDGHKFGFPLPSASRRQRVTEALEAVGAESYADARIGELSGGEQQRVLIAHALIGRPKLLLLDEPLANLDLKSEQGIVSVLSRLAREQDIAVLISAHDMNPLMRETDTVVYVAAGRAAAGRTDEIIRSEVLSALYGSQVDVLHVHGRVLVIAGDEQQEPQAHHPAETGIVVGPGSGRG